jgi:uncharacterized protein YnzC (UPF0291/DUF896 family)
MAKQTKKDLVIKIHELQKRLSASDLARSRMADELDLRRKQLAEFRTNVKNISGYVSMRGKANSIVIDELVQRKPSGNFKDMQTQNQMVRQSHIVDILNEIGALFHDLFKRYP